MRSRWLWVFLPVLLVSSARAQDSLPQRTIVVFNSRISESAALARFYAQKREIPRDHLIPLDCSTEEEISREEYNTNIADPLKKALEKRGFWKVHDASDGSERLDSSTINFVAVMKGLPLKVHPSASPIPGDKPGPGPIMDHNEASVDSELAALGLFQDQVSGALKNPYYQSYLPIARFHDAPIMMVSRLDAPDAASVRRMITDAIDAEKTGLWGRAYVDAAQNSVGGMVTGDTWMHAIVKELREAGVPVGLEDTPAVFPDGYPMSDCALYYGWYTGNITGPFNQPGFKFVPGAIAAHIHSYSASTVRDVNSGWAGPLIARGAAATVGNVYEPYLQLTAHFDILNDRLLHGFTWAESVWMATPALSWMTVALGDPLYRPYFTWTQLDTKSGQGRNDWRAYHEFAVKNANLQPPEFRARARQLALRSHNGAMLEDLGLTEVSDGKFDAAVSDLQLARANYSKRDDIIRCVLEESDALVKDGKPKGAFNLVRMVLRIVPGTPAAPLLRKIEADLTPRPPPPTPSPTPLF